MKDLTILQYHNVCSRPEVSDMWLSVQQFEKQLNYLQNDRFAVVSMDQAIDYMLNERTLNGRFPVSLTFDNGFEDFFFIVFPLLEKCRIPATVMVSPKKIGTAVRLNGQNVSYMNWEQLRRLIDAGITVGAFEDDHPSIQGVPRNNVVRHAREYKQTMEDKLGLEIRYFGAKEGVPDSYLRNKIREAEYRAFLTQCPTNMKLSLYAIGRIQVDEEDFNIFLTKISKTYLLFKDKQLWKYIRRYKLDRLAHHVSEGYNAFRDKQKHWKFFNRSDGQLPRDAGGTIQR